MSLLPLIFMNGILLIVTVLLAVADRLLVTYGACSITIEKEGKDDSFVVEGGSNLLSYLIEHNIEISSSCGGRGTCGYCKVRVTKGGGPILPTEEIFMSRQEKLDDMRLACQVKVKEDVEIVVPEFLELVREMVKNKKFDPNKRWRVTVM